MNDVRAVVRQFVLEDCRPGSSPSELSDDERLIQNGTLDSMSLIRLASLLERETGLEIEAHEVIEDNFGSVDLVVAFVAGRMSA